MLRVHDYVHVYGAKTTWCIRQSLGSRCYVDRFAFHLSILYIYLFCLQIDPSILGGLVVEFSQKVFDMSIRTRAAQMERFLRQPINLDGN